MLKCPFCKKQTKVHCEKFHELLIPGIHVISSCDHCGSGLIVQTHEITITRLAQPRVNGFTYGVGKLAETEKSPQMELFPSP